MRYFGQSILFIGKTIKRNQFLQCCLHIALLLRHPTTKNSTTKKQTKTHNKQKKKKQRNNKSMEVHDWLS